MGRKGFTIIELILVIVIIGIIAAMGIPRYNKAVTTAREKEIVNALKMLHAASEQYLARTGDYYQTSKPLSGLDTINNKIGADITIDPDVTFEYNRIQPFSVHQYTITADYHNKYNNTSSTIMVDALPLSDSGTTPNPYCSIGPCLTVLSR